MKKRQTNCIKCSRCIEACPLGLYPVLMKEAIERERLDEARRLFVQDCCCGTCDRCTTVCPSGIPLRDMFFPVKFMELRRMSDHNRAKRVLSLPQEKWKLQPEETRAVYVFLAKKGPQKGSKISKALRMNKQQL